MVLTSKKTNFNIEETKLYKSLKQLQKELQSRSDSEWFDWIYSRMEFDRDLAAFHSSTWYSYNHLLDLSFVVNNFESSVNLVLKENMGDLNYIFNSGMLTKMADRECLPSVNSDTIFSKGFVFYSVNEYYISAIKESRYISKDGKEKRIKKPFQIGTIDEIQNPKNQSKDSLRDVQYNKDTYLISKTIFPDKLFDELIIKIASDLEINLNPNYPYLEKVKGSFVKYERIINFEKLCWLSCELKNNLLLGNDSDKKELLNNFNIEADLLLNNPFLNNKKIKDDSSYFLSFLIKNYCNVLQINSYGKRVGTKMFSHIINGPVGSGHLGIFGTEDIPESKDEKDLLSLIEQKQILLEHLKLYESEFCSVLNKYHLKILQWMIKEYEIGTIPSISISTTVKAGITGLFISGFVYKLVEKLPPLTWLLKSNSRFLYSYVNELNNIKFNSRATSGRAPRGVFFR